MNIRVVLVVLVLAALAAAGFWLLRAPDLDGAAPAEGRSAVEESAGASAALTAGAPDQALTASGETAQRALVGDGKATPAVGFAGRVVDAAGRPLAGAVVTCAPAFDLGMGAGRGFDPETFDLQAFEPRAAMQRWAANEGHANTAQTDAEGRFVVGLPGTGQRFELRVRARKFTGLDRTLAKPQAVQDLGALTLRAGALVAGRVVERSGAAVGGALVQVGGAPLGELGIDLSALGVTALPAWFGQAVRSDAEGRFELPHVPAGKHALVCSHPRHPQARVEDVSVVEGSETLDLLVTLEPGAAIRGRVLDLPADLRGVRVLANPAAAAANEAPGRRGGGVRDFLARGVGVEEFGIGERSAELAADGSFALHGLRVGVTYRVAAVQAGEGFAGGSSCTAPLEVPSGSEGVELRYLPGVTVTMQVVDAASGAPLERLWVSQRFSAAANEGFDFRSFMPNSARLRTYPQGAVQFANLRPKAKQKLRVNVDAIGFRSFARDDIELPLTGKLELGVVKLTPAPVVRVTVKDPDGNPVADAEVRAAAPRAAGGRRGAAAEFRMGDASALANLPGMVPGMGAMFGGGPRRARTDAAGFAVVNAVLEATCMVSVTARDFASYEHPAVAVPEQGVDVAVTLRRGGTLLVTVVDDASKPVAEVGVDRNGSAGFDQRRTDGGGVARFDHVAPGKHRVRLGGNTPAMVRAGAMALQMGDDSGGNWTEVEVADEQVTEVKLVQQASVDLSGLVLENGVPLADATVRFVRTREAGNEGQPDLAAMFGGGRGGRGVARTDANGRYELRSLAAGQHRLEVSHGKRAMSTTVPVSLRPGSNQFDVGLSVAAVRGTVRDKQGQPVEGARMRAAEGDVRPEWLQDRGVAERSQNSGTPVTDAQGRYELRGVATGRPIRIGATAAKFAPGSSAVITVQDGQGLDDVDLVLSAAATLEVAVADAKPGTWVRVRRAEGDPATHAPITGVLRDGQVGFYNLSAGQWQVELHQNDGESPRRETVELAEGQKLRLTW